MVYYNYKEQTDRLKAGKEIEMKKIIHRIHKNMFMIWEYDHVIEYRSDGHIAKQYIINETITYIRGGKNK